MNRTPDCNLPTSTHSLEHLRGACIGSILSEMISITLPENYCYNPPVVQLKDKDKSHETEGLPDGPLRKRPKNCSPLDGPLQRKVPVHSMFLIPP